MKNNKFIYSSLFLLLTNLFFITFFVSCGRKQKNIFYFPENKYLEKINKLDLPATKILSVENFGNYNKITWQKVNLNSNFLKEKNIKFLGYNIYKLVNSSIVPKNCLNKEIINQDFFYDKKINKILAEDSYIIRTIFKKNNNILNGPASQVFSIKYN